MGQSGVDGITHERRNVCMWTTLFSSSHVGTGLATTSIGGLSVVLVDVEWLNGSHSYAVDVANGIVFRLERVGEVTVLAPLDVEYYDSLFSISYREALEKLLGGTDLYGQGSDPLLQERCASRVAAGAFGTDDGDLSEAASAYRLAAVDCGLPAGDTGAGVSGWVIDLARGTARLVVPAQSGGNLMIQPGSGAAAVATRGRLLQHALDLTDAVFALRSATAQLQSECG